MDLIIEYLRVLSDEERDRVIEAQEWTPMHVGFPGTPRCLVGHARGDDYAPLGHVSTVATALRFDSLCLMDGLPATVARIKAECARLNGVPTAAPARETVGAA